MPAIAQASTSGWAPASTATPTSPSTIPTIRRPVARSLCANQIASSATQIGTVAFAIAATPESMCCWPQAISVNGTRAVDDPEREGAPPGPPQPPEHAPARPSGRSSTIEAISSRPAISVVGSRSSSAISMNMNEAPQTAARESSSVR